MNIQQHDAMVNILMLLDAKSEEARKKFVHHLTNPKLQLNVGRKLYYLKLYMVEKDNLNKMKDALISALHEQKLELPKGLKK